jgi:uncharacterized repeat protein (TIGR01451 family)
LKTGTLRYIRSIAVVLALLLAIGVTGRAALAVAPSIGVSPSSGPAGAAIVVTGANFTPGQPVSVYFGGTFEGTFTASGTGAISAGFNVPIVAAGPYSISALSAGGNAATGFTVTASAAALNVTKLVTVNGLGYASTGSAVAGDMLTYKITVTNTSGATETGVTVTDALAAGQTAANTFSNCTYNGSTATVTCTDLASLAAGASITFSFSTVVNSGFSGTIVNSASASATGYSPVSSNSTVVSVNASHPTVTGQLQICGPVNAYTAPNGSTPASITISGVTVPFQLTATVYGTPIVVGSNLCVTITTNGYNAIASATASPNLAGLGFICGLYYPSSTPGTINVAGIVIPIAYGAGFNGLLVSSAFVCFGLNSAGQATYVLSGIPTSITFDQTRVSDRAAAAHAL